MTVPSKQKSKIWHPYASVTNPAPTLKVVAAEGTELILEGDVRMIDAMSSWWSVIHGYNHPSLNEAAKSQLTQFSHVMFGGLTHQPAEDLCAKLVDLTPDGLDTVFLSDTGSVSVEVALKMAAQFWQGHGKTSKQQFFSLRGGYHGDTRMAMSVSDPETGMHSLFSGLLREQFFLEKPPAGYTAKPDPKTIHSWEKAIATHAKHCAALILEPIVQGAGGMYFYAPEYLKILAELCRQHDLLLIADEIATGFGRSGRLFACEHANITPDILCVGKAMTGGYLTQAATLCTEKVASGVCASKAGVFMHGPTFMANPLACSISVASLDLLASSDWERNVQRIETRLHKNLSLLRDENNVAEVRVLGAIGVIETEKPVNIREINPVLIEHGVWLRPFGNLIYTMPPYITTDSEIDKITAAMAAILEIF